jgi:hypothetical protein
MNGLHFDNVDHRYKTARHWQRTFRDFAAELGEVDDLSQIEVLDLRRAASLAVALELMDAKLARGEEIHVGRYGFLAQSLQTVLARLGLSEDRKRGRNGHRF